MKFIDWLNNAGLLDTGVVLFRLVLAALSGAIIGLERGVKKRPAGMRTFSLVSMGSALAMMVGEYLFLKSTAMNGGIPTGDAARIAAQVIPGIGFLGAGTIIVTGKQQVKGLTTAAGLWASASVGLAYGIGFYRGAFYGSLLIVGIINLLHYIDEHLNSMSRVIELYIEMDNQVSLLGLIQNLNARGYRVTYFERSRNKTLLDGDDAALIEINVGRNRKHSEIVLEISAIEGIHIVDEV